MIKPALTAEEWKRQSFTRGEPDNVHITRRGGIIELDLQHSGNSGYPAPATRHAIAALMLDGQPFGFTREDVQLLHDVAYRLDDRQDQQERLDDLAERINALLPP